MVCMYAYKVEKLTARPSIGPTWALKCFANSMPIAFFFQNFKCPGLKKNRQETKSN